MNSKGTELKRWIERQKGACLLLSDFTLVVLCFMAAYYLRFHVELLAIKSVPVPSAKYYWKGGMLLAGIWVLMIGRGGGYETGLRGLSPLFPRLKLLLSSAALAVGLMMVLSFMYRGLLLSRQVYLMTGMLGFMATAAARYAFWRSNRRRKDAAKAVRLLVVGMDAQAAEFARKLKEWQGTYHIVGFLRWKDAQYAHRQSFAGRPILGTLEDEFEGFQGIDQLVLTSSYAGYFSEEQFNRVLVDLLNRCEEQSISLYMLAPSFDVAISRHEVGSLSGVPVIRLRDAAIHPGYAAAKRCLDVLAASVGVLLLLPVWAVIAAAIKRTSEGPVIFRQVRAGLHGRPFTIYKFRTMDRDAEAKLSELVDLDSLAVPGFKIENDPRITRFGRFLRRTALDETPQFINVLKGEMSLVGPRPEIPVLVDRYTPSQRRRLKAKPGLTGYQQIMARGEPLAACVKYDLTYLKYQSFLLDLYIMVRTFEVLIRDKGISR